MVREQTAHYFGIDLANVHSGRALLLASSDTALGSCAVVYNQQKYPVGLSEYYTEFDNLHNEYATEVIIRRYAGQLLHLYPHGDASFDEHADAQIYRVDARSNEHLDWTEHFRQRVEVSKENFKNFNITLPENGIDALDWAYDPSDDCHYEAEDPGQEPLVTRESIVKTIEKYPEVLAGNDARDDHVHRRVEYKKYDENHYMAADPELDLSETPMSAETPIEHYPEEPTWDVREQSRCRQANAAEVGTDVQDLVDNSGHGADMEDIETPRASGSENIDCGPQ
ncbi:hypothetical protein PV11_09625 [Exophiala sideris]|uniref:Uncharacterized protein n=1 Tax=Exophiala sideris TaxID=1016849 RepID=A0A0D1WRY3_9EURO|nr:hypothetical protein PV11_09625 [Exophiala sideris]